MIMLFLIILNIELDAATSLSYLDRIFDEIMVYYPLEKSDNFLKIIVNEESKKQEDLYELTEEDLKECEIFSEPEEIFNKHNFSSSMFKTYVESFYTKIHTFIRKYIPSKFHLTYIKRIDRIKQMIKLICKKKKTNRNILGKLIDKDCIAFNNCLFNKYKPHLELTEKVFNAFSSDLDRAIDGFFSYKFKEYEFSVSRYHHDLASLAACFSKFLYFEKKISIFKKLKKPTGRREKRPKARLQVAEQLGTPISRDNGTQHLLEHFPFSISKISTSNSGEMLMTCQHVKNFI